MDLEVIEMKNSASARKSRELKPHHQIKFGIIPKIFLSKKGGVSTKIQTKFWASPTGLTNKKIFSQKKKKKKKKKKEIVFIFAVWSLNDYLEFLSE